MSEWKVYSLPDIATFSQGKQIAVSDQYMNPSDKLERFIRIVDFTSGWTQEPRYVLKDAKYRVSNSDIVMLRYGTPGKVFRGHAGIIANNMFKITPNEDMLSKDYLYWFLMQDSVYRLLMANQSSSTMPAISFKMLSCINVSVPNRVLQEKICAILNNLDDKIAINRKICANLEAQAQALFKHWFIDFAPFKDGKFVDSELGMIPEGWKVGKLFDIAEIHDSKRRPLSGMERSKMKKIYPYYGATEQMDSVDDYIFEGKFVLMGEDGSVVRENGLPYIQYVWGKFWVNNHAHVLTGKNGFTTEMLIPFLTKYNIRGLVTGAVQAKLSQANMTNIKIAIPNTNILSECSELFDSIYTKYRQCRIESSHLSSLRDTLLPKLMSGEIKV